MFSVKMIVRLLRNDLENRECERTVFLKDDIESHFCEAHSRTLFKEGAACEISTFTQSTFKDTMLVTCGYRPQSSPISSIDIFSIFVLLDIFQLNEIFSTINNAQYMETGSEGSRAPVR